jgi:hypothetical protein
MHRKAESSKTLHCTAVHAVICAVPDISTLNYSFPERYETVKFMTLQCDTAITDRLALLTAGAIVRH